MVGRGWTEGGNGIVGMAVVDDTVAVVAAGREEAGSKMDIAVGGGTEDWFDMTARRVVVAAWVG